MCRLQAARSERSERPAAATAAKKSGLRDKMHVLLSRPAGRLRLLERAEWCEATKTAAELCRREPP